MLVYSVAYRIPCNMGQFQVLQLPSCWNNACAGQRPFHQFVPDWVCFSDPQSRRLRWLFFLQAWKCSFFEIPIRQFIQLKDRPISIKSTVCFNSNLSSANQAEFFWLSSILTYINNKKPVLGSENESRRWSHETIKISWHTNNARKLHSLSLSIFIWSVRPMVCRTGSDATRGIARS